MPERMLQKRWKQLIITSTSWRNSLNKVSMSVGMSGFPFTALLHLLLSSTCLIGLDCCRNFTCITSAYLVRRLNNGEFNPHTSLERGNELALNHTAALKVVEASPWPPPPPPVVIVIYVVCLRNWFQAEWWCLYGLDEECSVLCGSKG